MLISAASFDFRERCLRGALPVRRPSFPVPVFAALPMIAVAIRLGTGPRDLCGELNAAVLWLSSLSESMHCPHPAAPDANIVMTVCTHR